MSTPELLIHFRYTTNSLNPLTPLAPLVRGETCQGDFGNFSNVGVIGKRLLISLIHQRLNSGQDQVAEPVNLCAVAGVDDGGGIDFLDDCWSR